MAPRRLYAFPLAALAASAILAACGGGGGSGAPSVPAGTGRGAASALGIHLSGSSIPLTAARRAASVDGAPVVVSYGGSVVAAGSLDASGSAELHFTASVPSGTTVTVTIGAGASAIAATIVLSQAVGATVADVVYSPGPPPAIVVTSEDDPTGSGNFSAGGSNQESSTENPENGDPENVNSSDNPVLPANVPIAISTCGQTITFVPAASAPSGLSLQIEEKVHDDDNGMQFELSVPSFTAPVTVPILATAARFEIALSQNGQEILQIEAPLGAFNAMPTSGTCPSPTPTNAPSMEP